ncbi:MAG TPA: tRNA (adenosine(37)-N6)-threonylcarbamoyltransferase complex dimerization subunit type 1 TsaB [Burkholderiaceae bacterium]|nr:tRNA (adenosine(37)-N6)-threonylcarbamoyltransferase complex dimerization subunit type 1 TsaB [Burkholderiaceae bacterium]
MPNAPVLLALDTATSVCAVAVARAGAIDEVAREVGQRHSEHLLSMVDALLAAHSLRLEDCDAIAFGAGPGSFTGLRIACGVAQGLGYGVDRPLIPVSNLAAGALEAFAQCPDARTLLVAQDARMNEAYVGVYAMNHGGLREVAAPRLAAPRDLPELAEHYEVDAIAGNALQIFGEQLVYAGRRIKAAAAGGARAIARLGLDALAAGITVEAAAAAPIYVRDHVALTVEERRTRGRRGPAGA